MPTLDEEPPHGPVLVVPMSEADEGPRCRQEVRAVLDSLSTTDVIGRLVLIGGGARGAGCLSGGAGSRKKRARHGEIVMETRSTRL